jgi:hypothetical protein
VLTRRARVQVVLHGSMKQTRRRSILHRLYGRTMTSSLPPLPGLTAMSDTIAAPFCQNRVYTTDHGSISLFATGNVIRAAKGHPATAVAAMARFSRWLHAVTDGAAPPWFSAVSTPNAVATGMFSGPCSAALQKSWAATSTSKFPGVAVTLATAPGVTPEVFRKGAQAKFIVPGFKGPEELSTAVTELCALQGP